MPSKPMNPHDLDRTDRRILDALQRDGRLPMTELAQQVGLSTSPVIERVRPVIEAMGELRKVGGYGNGYVAKLVNNQLWKIHAAAIGEAMVTANWRKKMPGMPGTKAVGTNTEVSTREMAIRAPDTSCIDR